jgi:hypothetical protein
MNCQDVAALLDEHACNSLLPVQQKKVSEHMFHCEGCANAWRSSRELHALREKLPAPPRAGLFPEAMVLATATGTYATDARRSNGWDARVPIALAASILVAVLTFGPAAQKEGAGPSSEPVIASNDVRDVNVAIDAKEALTGVEIHVLLSDGIAVSGFAGRSALSWKTDLAPGVNRLTLPISGLRAGGGELTVRVEHQGRHREFRVRVSGNTADPRESDAIG